MRIRRGWIPAIVAPVVVVAAALVVPAVANAATPPPTKTAAQVLDLIASSASAQYSGTVRQSSDLGIPQVPASMAPASGGFDVSSMLEMLTGSHTAQVYVDGPTRQRVQLRDTLSERDVIHNGSTLWLYDAADRTATKLTGSAAQAGAPTAATTPAKAAETLIAGITPTTAVTVTTGTDLGRGVYVLTLTPKTSATLVGDAVITVDAVTGVPLAAQVDARGQSSPAVRVAFESVDFTRPAADIFAFTPPKGTTVHEQAVPEKAMTDAASPRDHAGASSHAPKVIGTGWTSILSLPAGAARASGADQTDAPTGNAADLINRLTQKVDGGRMLSTSLVTVYLRDDGAVFVGAVPSASLLAAAR